MRTYYLLSYDISDPKRWRKVFRIAHDFGDHIQYSVFLCELGDKDKIILEERLKDAISNEDDKVLILRLRTETTLESAITALGRPIKIIDEKNALIY